MIKNIKLFLFFDSYDCKYNKRFKLKNNFWLCRKIIIRKFFEMWRKFICKFIYCVICLRMKNLL